MPGQRSSPWLALAGVTSAAIAAMYWVAAAAEPERPDFLSLVVAKLDALHRVTDVPHPLADSTVTDCKLVYNANIHEGRLSRAAYCHVYVSAEAKEPIIAGADAYPAGAVIVKAKLPSEESRDAELFTVMRKMEPGYDADHGDWEYAVVDGPSKRVMARGRIDSCIECHRHYAATDHVTRAYMNP